MVFVLHRSVRGGCEMADLKATEPKSGDVKTCSDCGHETAVYTQVPNSIFVSAKEAAYPGRLPDIYAWVCSRCGHEEREAPQLVRDPAHT
jgi:Zn ribbon nucleic-acid-binding protein